MYTKQPKYNIEVLDTLHVARIAYVKTIILIKILDTQNRYDFYGIIQNKYDGNWLSLQGDPLQQKVPHPCYMLLFGINTIKAWKATSSNQVFLIATSFVSG